MIFDFSINNYIERAYAISAEHGFHDEPLSVEHLLMLVLGEVGEIVEADRRGRRADVDAMMEQRSAYPDFKERFVAFVKDTLEDEIADVAIRLFDLCGEKDLKLRDDTGISFADEFEETFGGLSLSERCFWLCCLLCSANTEQLSDDGSDTCLPVVVGSALRFLSYLCEDMGIDMEKHIELKMRYNELRPFKNGKKY